MTVDLPPLQEIQLDASDEAEIAKAISKFANEGYTTRVVRSQTNNTVTIQAKLMNPKFHAGFELED